MAFKWADVEASDKYKSASPELQIEIQDKYFDTQVKTAPGYDSKWESSIKSKLFGRSADKGGIEAAGYSMAEAITKIPEQLATGFNKLFPNDIVAEKTARLDKRRAFLSPEQITKEENNIKQVSDYLKLENANKIKLDKDIASTKEKHPVASFAGSAVGGVVPFMAAGATGLPLWASFGGLGLLEEGSRQFANPEENLNPIQRAAKISISAAAGAITGQIFKEVDLAGNLQKQIGPKALTLLGKQGIGQSFLSRALQRAGGAGATAITESILDEFASGKQPDVNQALKRGATNAVSIAVFSYLTELPELRSAVFNEANSLSARANRPPVKTYEEAKAIVKEASINPEELSPQFKQAKQDFVRQGLKRDVAENINYYKKNLGWNDNQINEFLSIKSVNQFDDMAGKYARVNPEFVKQILPFRKDIASGLTTPEEIVMALELRKMAEPKTTQSEVIKSEKVNETVAPAGQVKERLASKNPAKPIEPAINTPKAETPSIQVTPIQLPDELTKGEHLFTPEQALDKTVSDLNESQYIQNDIFQNTVQGPIEANLKALNEQLASLKGQRGGEVALARKDINNKIETLEKQLSQAEDTIQEQTMDWGMKLQDIIKTKAREQGLDLDEYEMQNLADDVTMAISEPWGQERYWDSKLSDVVDDTIAEYKEKNSPEYKAKEAEVEAQRLAVIDKKIAKGESILPKDTTTKFNAEIIASAKKVMKPGDDLETEVARTKDWIASVLDNDESSTKEELVAYFQKEGGFSKEVSEQIVSKRGQIRSLPMGVKKEMKQEEEKSTTSSYKLAGYYDTTGSTEKDEHEMGNLMPEKKLKKDITKFAKALKEELGWDWGKDRKGKAYMPSTNIAPIGGNATISLAKPGSDWGVYISIDTERVNGDDLELGGIMGKHSSILYRATKQDDPWGGQSNNFAASDISVGELAKLVKKTVDWHEPMTDKEAEESLTILKETTPVSTNIKSPGLQYEDDFRDYVKKGMPGEPPAVPKVYANDPIALGKLQRRIKSEDLENKGKFKLSILQTPTGRFIFVGSVPKELTVFARNSIGQEYQKSQVYNTEAEAIADAKKYGYEVKPGLTTTKLEVETQKQEAKSAELDKQLELRNALAKYILSTSLDTFSFAEAKRIGGFATNEEAQQGITKTKKYIEGLSKEQVADLLKDKTLTIDEKNVTPELEAENGKDSTGTLSKDTGISSGGQSLAEQSQGRETERQQQSIQSEVKRARRAQHNQESNEESRQANLGNYRITGADNIGVGSPKEKYKSNVQAIKLLKQIELENRKATPDEQSILVKYVGWGGLSKVFDRWNNKGWEKENEELSELLTDDEYSAARASTINAHYTSPLVINAMWKAVLSMGFERGKVLEPAMGIGHFIGLRPESARIAFTGIELDSLTGRIAKQLYQNGDVQVKGFQEAQLSRNFYDLAISNVPFADVKPYDPKAKELGIPSSLNLHDYFFAKSLALVKEGGVIAFITSKGTMDKIDSKVRAHLAEKADLLGAIRLPNTAFKGNAGTEVTTDIIFLRKRLPGEKPAGEAWLNAPIAKISNRNVNVNEYFIKNTAMILGNMKVGKGLYSEAELFVEPFEELLQVSLDKAIDFLPKNIIKSQADIIESQKPEERITDDTNANQGTLILKSGKIYQKNGEELIEQKLSDNEKDRVIGMIHIKEVLKELYIKQEKSDNDADFKLEQTRLNSLYDKFVKKYGPLSDSKNEDLFADDPSRTRLLSLEIRDKVSKKYVKNEDIFNKRVIHHHRRPTQADTGKDAAYASLAEYGHLNWRYMSEITDRTEEDLQKELSELNLIFKNPEGETWELKDEYLSGNVKLKLSIAEAATKLDNIYNKNISALKEVIPADKTFQEITARVGTPWIEALDHKEFIAELLEVSRHNLGIEYNAVDGLWDMSLTQGKWSSANTVQWGTERYPAIKIIEAIANNKQIKVYDKVTIDGEEKSVLNEQETAVAQDKAETLKQKFADWFWQDEERRNKYLKLYNEEFNAIVNRCYDGSHLTLPGMSPIYIPRKTQLDAIYRGIVSKNLLLAHEVGAGKTLIMIAIIMESKRLGLIKKPLVVVPKNTLSQWKRQFNTIYPAANILVADEKNFTKNKRQMFLSKASSGNWDAIIMASSSNYLIDVSDELYHEYMEEQLDELRAEKERQRNAGSKITIKQIEKAIQKKEELLKEKLDRTEKDKNVTFEELGIDSVFVDEADKFKNLAYNTKMQGVKGLGAMKGNETTEDLMMKLRVVRKRGGKVVFATGTPISNSMAEVHVMMKYLQPDLLNEKGLKHFDSWAKAFGELSMDYEVDASGRLKSITRFSKFVNLQSLLTMLNETWDIQTAEMLEAAGILVKGKNLPFYKGGKPGAAFLQPTKELEEYIQELGERADAIKGKKALKGGDNMLVILMDGIMASTDMRLIDPTLPGNPNSKIEYAINGIYERWEKTVNTKDTQIVFIDRVKPDEKALFNPQWYMKRKLIEMGIPEKEIAFIHDFEGIEEKDELYEKVNNGDVRILFGSTEKLGAGTNVQERLTTLWHIDTPYRPRDIIQREGRIMRPSENYRKEVEVIRLATVGSFDSFLWQLLEIKAKYIADVMSGKIKTDVMDESFDEYSIIKAATSNNPLLKEKVALDKEIRNLTNIKNAFLNEKFKSQKLLKEIPEEIKTLAQRIEKLKADIAKRPEKLVKENFTIEIEGKEYKTKEDAWTAIKKALDNIRIEDWSKDIPLGKYQGLPISLFIYNDSNNNIRQNRININGAFNYEAVFSDSAIGTFASIDSALYTAPDKLLQNANMRYEESNKHLIISKAIAEKEFDRQKTLDEKLKRQIEVNRLLREKTEGTQAKDNDDIIEMHSGFMFGNVKEEPVDDKLNTDPAAFIDSEVERRFKEAHGQRHPDSLVFHIKQFMNNLWGSLKDKAESFKVFPGLPGGEYFAEAKFILGLQQHSMTIAKDKTIRNMHFITHKFGPKKLNLFTRAIILADFVKEVEKGRPVPLGYSHYDEEGKLVINSELLSKDKANIDALVALNPDVKAALERRKVILKEITDDLVKYKILTKDQLKEDYFRHQVLEYANAKATFSTGKKLKTPHPKYGRRRFGTVDKDINTNYLEAEFEFMSQALYDIETAKTIDKLRTSKYNIKDSLKEEAKKHNDEMLDRVTIEGEYNKAGEPATLRDLIKPFNSKIGFGFSILEKEGYQFPKESPNTFEELAKIAESETAEPNAQKAARMILKAISGRKDFIKKHLGKHYQEWQDIIPEGYTTWQPKEGRMFYNAFSVPQRIINEIVNKAGEEANIDKDDLKKLLAVGGMREEFVLPQGLVDTLNNIYTIKLPDFIDDAIKAIIKLWKPWVLMNPRRAFSYNFQNLLGDMDHVIAANPKILKYFNRAVQELGDMFYKGKVMTEEMREFFERGGLSTMLTIQELPDVNKLEIFQGMTRDAEKSFSLKNAQFEIKKALNYIPQATIFRESILRYAAYLYYRDVFLTGNKEFGGSRREDVEGLINPLDKAAKVATDTLGDYSMISQLMKDARQTLIPFGSWLEVNFKIYYNLNRNALIEGGMGKGLETFVKTGVGAGARATAMASLFYLRFLIGMVAMTAIVGLYNQLFHAEEEQDLNPYDQNRMHLTIGRDKNGHVKIRRGQGAFADILEWAGLDQSLVLLRDYFEGKASFADIFGKIPFVTGKIGLKPAVLKIMRGINPLYKAGIELATGKYLPGLDERSGVVEDKLRNILKAWSLENEYDWITKKPSRGYIKSWEQAFITTTDPEENAFRYIQGLKYSYRERLGKGGSGDYYTPRSILYRQYKKALLYKDESARVAAIKEMIKLGVTAQDLERSVKTQNPLHGLSENERMDFVRNFLSVRDREKLKTAYRYYLKTFAGSEQ